MSDRPALQDNTTPNPTGAPVSQAGVATLARELADWLVEFSIVLHKRAMYPHGHPHLQESAERFVDRLESLLERREVLVIGVARHQLIIGGGATDPRNALLSDLARRLHRQRIASIRFQRDVTLREIDELLGSLSGEAGEAAGPLGLRLERAASWRHVQIQAPELGRLLLDQGGHEPADEPPEGFPEDLWVGLANLALSADGGPSGADDAERRCFALTASEVLAVDAVVEVVEAAAVTTGQSISSHLLRLLHKFAHHAERTTGPARSEAESVLRKNVAQLIANWELDDPNPAEYTAVLEGLVRQVPPPECAVVETESGSCDAESNSCDAAAVAYEHHRCVDGRGYPALHYQRETHYASRLVHVCDVYDALRTRRPYRDAWTSMEALEYIRRRSGTEFDPHTVVAFLEMMQRWDDRISVEQA